MFGSAKAKDVCSRDMWVNEESSEDNAEFLELRLKYLKRPCTKC